MMPRFGHGFVRIFHNVSLQELFRKGSILFYRVQELG